MKCPTCGASLQIEDEKCPFCGNENPFAVKHRQDMQYYRQEFQKTKQETEKKVRHFNSVTARITVIAVLLVLILCMLYMIDTGAYYVWSGQVKRETAKNAQDYAGKLDALEQDGDWMGLYAFYEAKNLGYTDTFREYTVLYQTIFDYKCILNNITRQRTGRSYYSDSVSETAAWIAQYLDTFYQSVERTAYEGTYYEDCYQPEHREAYARLRQDLEAVLAAYCHLTKEELEALPDYSVAKKGSLIEEGLCRETDADDREGAEE